MGPWARRIGRGATCWAIVLGLGGLIGVSSGAGALAGAAKGKCTKQPFVGSVARTAESGSAAGQPAASRETADFESAVVYDFGNKKNYTVYVGDYEVDPDDLGGTLEAPDGDVLVTIFLRSASGKALKPGTRLTPGKDPVSVIVDAGAGARAVTSQPTGRIDVLSVDGKRLCFRIDYADDFQTVDGVVSAVIP